MSRWRRCGRTGPLDRAVRQAKAIATDRKTASPTPSQSISDADQRLEHAAEPEAQAQAAFHRRQHDAFAIEIDDRLVVDVLVHLDAIAGDVMAEPVGENRRP